MCDASIEHAVTDPVEVVTCVRELVEKVKEMENNISVAERAAETIMMDVEGKTSSGSSFVQKSNGIVNHGDKFESSEKQIDAEDKENNKDDLNTSHGESTTKILSKALKTLVSEDMDTVTPPRKVKTKTPVKKKNNLFRPYDLDDRKSTSIPSQSPMLLRANYECKGQANAWHIESRSKTETIVPHTERLPVYKYDTPKRVDKKHAEIELRTQRILGDTNSENVKTKDTSEAGFDKSRHTSFGDKVGFESERLNKEAFLPSVNARFDPPLQASTPKRPRSESEYSIRSNESNLQPKDHSNKSATTVDDFPTTPGVLTRKSDSQLLGSVKVFQMPESYNSKESSDKPTTQAFEHMCQKISNAMGKLAEGLVHQKSSNIRIPPAAANTFGQNTQQPGIKRPDSCPPRMTAPCPPYGSLESDKPKGVLSKASGDLVETIKETWALHHTANTSSMPLTKDGRTVLPSISTFSNKPFSQKRIGMLKLEDKPTGPAPRPACIRPIPSLSVPTSSHDTKSETHEHINPKTETLLPPPLLRNQGPSFNLKRPSSLSVSESSNEHAKDCKLLKREISSKASDNKLYIDTEGNAMRIPLRPPLPSPNTGLMFNVLHSSQHGMARSQLPLSVNSSHMNKFDYLSSLHLSKMFDSSHKSYENPCAKGVSNNDNVSTIESVKKKLNMNSVDTKTNDITNRQVTNNSYPLSETLKSSGIKPVALPRYVEEKNARNIKESIDVVTNSEETKATEFPKYTVSDTIPRYDIENAEYPSAKYPIKLDKSYGNVSPSKPPRRPLGISALENQVLMENQRLPSRVTLMDRPEPFSVRRTPEAAFGGRPQNSTPPVFHNEALLHSAHRPFVHRPFAAPVCPVSTPSIEPAKHLKPPMPVIGPPLGHGIIPSQPIPPMPLTPPVADKVPVAALLLMMKVSLNFKSLL